jgi:hypothetical protein
MMNMEEILCITREEYELILDEIKSIKEELTRINEKIDHDRNFIYKDEYTEISY